jgi:hypothetical protein
MLIAGQKPEVHYRVQQPVTGSYPKPNESFRHRPAQFFKVYFRIILKSRPVPPKWYLPFVFCD